LQLKLIVTALVSLIIALNDSAWSATPEAQWIWQGPPAEGQKLWFRKHFTLDTPAKAARIAATCDNQFTLFVNGQRTLGSQNWEQVASADISKLLRAGENVIAVEARNKDGIAGFLGSLKIIDGNGMEKTIVSDRSWRATNKLKQDWHLAAFDDHDWRPAEELGVVGLQALPWSAFIDARSLLDVSAPESVRPKTAKNVTIGPPGFKVELVYEVPKGQGSWVSITNDDRGRLIVSDQQGAGLYLITPAQIGDAAAESTIQKLPVKLSGAQGLLYAFDSLYVMTHAGKRGIHRAKDTDGDGLLDSSEFIMPVSGDGEHGPHALILTPDKKSILVAAGNHTRLPSQVTASRIPMNWGEDLLLPRHWDVSGHAAGVLAPGGWICKIDPTGKQCEVMSIGYRNQYDMALNADGELFTFDADMEYDFGSPWYRPTRVCHATSGSEFGWRSGTGKWPSYYEDSIPSAVDIGPGSPVGITFGYGAKFPAKYQKALFLLDWTYSTIYAAHLTPDGASYRGEVEDFMHGEPMQVTDAVVNSDGALYFTVGGRGTQSALYRVVYAGDESTAPVDATDKQGAELRVLRKQLEEFHRPGKADLNLIWANLGHEDRFIRYAARIALEHQPLDAWRTKIATETNWRTAITALMALARQGKADDLEPLLAALDKLDWKKLSEQEQLAAARTYALAFIRLGKPSTEWQQKLITRLLPKRSIIWSNCLQKRSPLGMTFLHAVKDMAARFRPCSKTCRQPVKSFMRLRFETPRAVGLRNFVAATFSFLPKQLVIRAERVIPVS
jgi:glucose/arabinose dehydrogenase